MIMKSQKTKKRYSILEDQENCVRGPNKVMFLFDIQIDIDIENSNDKMQQNS